MDNYQKLAQENLRRLYADLPTGLAERLPARQNGSAYTFEAFGQTCVISPERITLNGITPPGVTAILLSLYAMNACPEPCIVAPLKAFKEFADATPYVGAFASHTEQILVPAVARIKRSAAGITQRLSGEAAPPAAGGDFAFLVRPLPKICLCYIFYEADEEFPPSATCLFSCNAGRFMPIDGLADLGEYTSKTILGLIDA
jgi:hypothetical protein